MYADLNISDMVEYGYMEDGFLNSIVIKPIVERYKDGDVFKERIISVEEQIANLDPVWKPVDPIDEDKQETTRENYVIRIIPYDAGDRIAYNYVEVPDVQGIKRNIQSLKEQLSDSDYQIIKCYEASLIGEELPYDMQSLHSERQGIRDRINELEYTLSEFENELAE